MVRVHRGRAGRRGTGVAACCKDAADACSATTEWQLHAPSGFFHPCGPPTCCLSRDSTIFCSLTASVWLLSSACS